MFVQQTVLCCLYCSSLLLYALMNSIFLPFRPWWKAKRRNKENNKMLCVGESNGQSLRRQQIGWNCALTVPSQKTVLDLNVLVLRLLAASKPIRVMYSPKVTFVIVGVALMSTPQNVKKTQQVSSKKQLNLSVSIRYTAAVWKGFYCTKLRRGKLGCAT